MSISSLPGLKGHVAVAALNELAPPLFDTWVDNQLRRRVVLAIARERDIFVDSDLVHRFDKPYLRWRNLFFAILWWPFKKILRLLFGFLIFWDMYKGGRGLVEFAVETQALLIAEGLGREPGAMGFGGGSTDAVATSDAVAASHEPTSG